jgi:hypothetical protein
MVHFVCDVEMDIPDGHWEISISTADGTQVTYSTTLDCGREPTFIAKGRHAVTAAFDTVLLPLEYTIGVGVHYYNGMTADFVQRALNFTILRVAENGEDHYLWPRTRGLVRARARWSSRGCDVQPLGQNLP